MYQERPPHKPGIHILSPQNNVNNREIKLQFRVKEIYQVETFVLEKERRILCAWLHTNAIPICNVTDYV